MIELAKMRVASKAKSTSKRAIKGDLAINCLTAKDPIMMNNRTPTYHQLGANSFH